MRLCKHWNAYFLWWLCTCYMLHLVFVHNDTTLHCWKQAGSAFYFSIVQKLLAATTNMSNYTVHWDLIPRFVGLYSKDNPRALASGLSPVQIATINNKYSFHKKLGLRFATNYIWCLLNKLIYISKADTKIFSGGFQAKMRGAGFIPFLGWNTIKTP